MIDIVVKVETPLHDGDRTGVFPVGDIDVVIGQEGLDRAAQQSRIVAGQGGHDQHRGIDGALSGAAQVRGPARKMQHLDPRAMPEFMDRHRDGTAVHQGFRNAPFRLAIAPGDIGVEVGGGEQVSGER